MKKELIIVNYEGAGIVTLNGKAVLWVPMSCESDPTSIASDSWSHFENICFTWDRPIIASIINTNPLTVVLVCCRYVRISADYRPLSKLLNEKETEMFSKFTLTECFTKSIPALVSKNDLGRMVLQNPIRYYLALSKLTSEDRKQVHNNMNLLVLAKLKPYLIAEMKNVLSGNNCRLATISCPVMCSVKNGYYKVYSLVNRTASDTKFDLEQIHIEFKIECLLESEQQITDKNEHLFIGELWGVEEIDGISKYTIRFVTFLNDMTLYSLEVKRFCEVTSIDGFNPVYNKEWFTTNNVMSLILKETRALFAAYPAITLYDTRNGKRRQRKKIKTYFAQKMGMKLSLWNLLGQT